MQYAKFKLNKVVQIQPYMEKGFIKVPQNVTNGHILEDGLYKAYNHTKVIDSLYVEDKEAKLQDEQKTFRLKRDEALMELDVYQGVLRYNSLTPEHQLELALYRQALLDSTTTWEVPAKPEWV